jgi:hypothetical protein
MRRLYVLVTVAAALLALPTAHSAVVVNESIPFATIVFVPCANDGAGELVLLEGQLHILLTETVNDNHISFKGHFQPQGVGGTGVTTGDMYRGTGVTQDHVSLGPGVTQTFVNNFRIIGQGPDNNFLVHNNVHVTINANGVVTAVVDNFTVDCK